MKEFAKYPFKKLFLGLFAIAVVFTLEACDKGKKPYEEAEALFNRSDYAAAKSKAVEVVQNAPNSKYLTQAKELIQKVDKVDKLWKDGPIHIENDDYENGLAVYKELLSHAPNDKIAVQTKQDVERILAEANESGDKTSTKNIELEITKWTAPLSLDKLC